MKVGIHSTYSICTCNIVSKEIKGKSVFTLQILTHRRLREMISTYISCSQSVYVHTLYRFTYLCYDVVTTIHTFAVMETTPAHCQGDQPVAFPSTHSTVAYTSLKNCPVIIKVTWTCPADSQTQ